MKFNFSSLQDKITLDLTEKEMISAHKVVISSILNLNNLIPDKYQRHGLANILVAKTDGYHTSLDNKFYWYCRIKKTIKKIIINDFLASNIAFRLILLKKASLNKWTENKREEIEIAGYSKEREHDLENRIARLDNNRKNIFFASSQTYLKVISIFLNKSEYENNVLIVPRCIQGLRILDSINEENIFYFDDFITRNMFEDYEDSKLEFSEHYNENIQLIRDNFLLESKDFFDLIEVGVKNVFNYLLPQAFLFAITYERILGKINTRNVIGVRVRKIYDRALYETAHRLKINRYILLHSNIGSSIKFIHSMGHFNNITGVFVWGGQQKSIIENDVFSSVEKIYVLGSPLFEDVGQDMIVNSGPSIIHKRILYAAGMPDLRECSVLVDFVNKYNIAHINDGIELIIKVHPDEKSTSYIQFLNSKITLVEGKEVLEDYFPKVDLLVTTVSESSLQAALYHIPMHMMIFSELSSRLCFDLYGLSNQEEKYLVSNKKSELYSKLKKILFEENYCKELLELQDKFLRKRIFIPSDDNKPTASIGKILNEEERV